MATVFHSLSDRKIFHSSLGYDPLLKNALGQKSENKLVAANRFVSYRFTICVNI